MPKTDLPKLPAATTPRASRTARARAAATERTLRKPTGRSTWPTMLVVGGPRAETAVLVAEASGSDLVDRTFWVGWEERTPDALGAITGASFEIAEHDGTLDDFEAACDYVLGIPRQQRPHLFVLDGGSQLWDSIKDWAGKKHPAGSNEFWDAANDRYARLILRLREYDGPVVIIGRLADGTVLGHRSLQHSVDIVIEMDDDGIATVSAPRVTPSIAGTLPSASIEDIWLLLNLDQETKA